MSRDPGPPDGDNLLPVRKWRVEARDTIVDGDGAMRAHSLVARKRVWWEGGREVQGWGGGGDGGFWGGWVGGGCISCGR